MIGTLSCRRFRAGWALSLIVAAGCAPAAPPLSDVPLAINYEWPPARPWWENATAQVDPSAVILRWQPDRFSAGDIRAIASQQCGRFQRAATASRPPSPTGRLLSQRFACVAETKTLAPP